jgi:DNA-binding CsgD family transcriptional regulator
MLNAYFSRGAGVRANVEGCLKVVADFTRAMERDGRVEPALQALAALTGADAAMITRLGAAGPRRLAAWEPDAGRLFTPRNRPSLAADMLELAGQKLKAGSVVVLSDLAEPGTLRDLAEARCLDTWPVGDAVFVLLGSSRSGTDLIELHLRHAATLPMPEVFAPIGGMLAELWRDRVAEPKPLAAVETGARHRPAPVDILSMDNPVRLSRAEFRVCQLVRSGRRAGEIADALHLQECTVRSHLRSIYAKANVSGQVGLMSLLAQDDGRARMVAGRR